ncbi:helix-turn-helix domain-containing protein [Stackebrandtia nassauensis]|uniref:Transcriptional regulator, XRE family n=1 Tax=Stackebrandtia nassauensis (strain DSM 44728 / CIP 108903 / NRRL B-16338 / NBRC 102104 / LLR-40K-21) TaxID=446470 RepID=D3PXE6_STANL|nr:helix-turn-helix transcriptional regulator [Stackebrandtia nassauensis]ADD41409.1 transcriptional regulator, XRE family [Stackebrandtia nassauensis DSM 44728]
MRRGELAARRRARGHTQETLAQRLGVNVSSVARWERGLAIPYPHVRRALAEELGLPVEELTALLTPAADPEPAAPSESVPPSWNRRRLEALATGLRGAQPATDTPGHAAHAWLVTPPPAEWSWLATRIRDHHRPAIGSATIARIRARTDYLRTADDIVAGGDLHHTIQRELAVTAELLSTTRYTDHIGRQLLAALAELSQLCGWSTADAADPARATGYYLSGIAAAHAADLPELGAELTSALAYHLTETNGDAAEAVLVARSALAGLRRLDAPTPRMLAMVHARLAWALNAAGETRSALDAMNRAQDHFAARDDTRPDPGWLYWLSASEMDIIVGRFEAATHQPEAAQRRLRTSLSQCDPHHVREHTLYTTWLAHTYLDTGDTDQAADLAQHCQRLDATIDSAFSRRAVHHLTNRLTTPA